MTAALPIRSRRHQESEHRRTRVLEAANRCFGRTGYAKTSVEVIAQEAGVSKGLVFAFFDNKQKLFEAVLTQTLTEWAQVSDQKASPHKDDPERELEQLFHASFEFVEQRPMLLAIMRRDERVIMREHWPLVEEVNRKWQKRIGGVLRKGIKLQVFRPDLDVARTADVFHQLQRAYLDRIFNNGNIAALDPKQLRVAVDLILHSVRLSAGSGR